MVYKMRFIQYFNKSDTDQFLELEREFIRLEQQVPEIKNGKRFLPVIGREPTNAMIWEAEFESLDAATEAMSILEQNSDHDRLLNMQIKYMRDTFVEIYKEID